MSYECVLLSDEERRVEGWGWTFYLAVSVFGKRLGPQYRNGAQSSRKGAQRRIEAWRTIA
jgi:hypothetical protein